MRLQVRFEGSTEWKTLATAQADKGTAKVVAQKECKTLEEQQRRWVANGAPKYSLAKYRIGDFVNGVWRDYDPQEEFNG